MESRDYEKILNAMPETGVYVVREEDRGILYFNKRVQEVSPEVQIGAPCYEIWAGSCSCCPLLTIGERQESRSVSYNDPYGGVVDITATRTLWEGATPAFVVTVAPRMDSGGYTYRKILRVDLDRDMCEVLKSDPEGWQPGEGILSGQMEEFARSGAIHPDDVGRFVDFTRLERLRASAQMGENGSSLLYRRRVAGVFRWNLMEVVPDSDGGQFVILCVKDVHDVLREGQEREGFGTRSQELIRSLGERNFNIYTIDLNAGVADPIRVDGQMWEGMAPPALPWTDLMRAHIKDRLHPAYQEEFEHRFSLEGLRQAREEGQQKTEMLCQWRQGKTYRYISVAAYFSRELKAKSYTVLALQDVDERMRRELAHTQRDMQMAAVLRSRFRTMATVDLNTGRCEYLDLTQAAGLEDSLTYDYAQYIQESMDNSVHPDDRRDFWAALCLDHLREKARTVVDYAEEVCQYRMRGELVRWIERRVIYSRQKDQVRVNILGQDITREKQQEESQLQTLEDRAYIISSLSSLFFSTYYIDLEHDSFRAVTQLHRVGDVLGGEVNCTAALQVYANHFIHPDDREEYLSVMNVQNLRDTLRWWQPYVAVEYRRLPDDPEAGEEACGWVRATAALARTGSDDMPKTAVYVAQDITNSKRRPGPQPGGC